MSQDTAFENLANAIILKAMEDYSAALRYMRHHMSPEFLYKSQIKPTNAYKEAWSHHRHERWACEHFFKSDWADSLRRSILIYWLSWQPRNHISKPREENKGGTK